MTDDPIVEEIRKIRQAHAAKYNNNFELIYAAIKEGEKKYAHRLVNRKIKEKPVSISL